MDHKRYVLNQNRPRPWRLLLAWAWLTLVPLLASGCGVEQPTVYRVGILSGHEPLAIIIDGFKAGMTELGYLEGQHITYDVQHTDVDREAYRQVLQKFVADEVDLIFVITTEAALEAKAATEGTGIPVVFAYATTERTGLVESVRQPGNNITGVRTPGPETALKRFEVMHELLPQARRIWIPYQRDYPSVPVQLALLTPAAEAAGITLLEAPATSAAELAADLAARATPDDPGMDAILFLGEPLNATEDAFAVIARFAAQHRVPMVGRVKSADEYGGVLDVRIDTFVIGKQAAFLADKIFNGTPPGSLPVLSPDSYLQINYRMAEELGITVPEGLLKQADEIIR
ncbi:MAG: hypothetical protein HC884_06240 [Chloroflexaceae bacterium]|nr:hypothetical protein [Chloroflexaceae bacterium]